MLSSPLLVAHRARVPDIARGLMLLLIALAHAPAYLVGRPLGLGDHPVDGSALDKGVTVVELTTVVGRAYPMFAALLGYGLVALWNRQTEAGASAKDAARLLRRRGLWLLAFGLVHAAMLWRGDILGAYGIVTVLAAAGLLRVRGRVAGWVLAGSLLLVAAGGAGGVLAAAEPRTSPLPSTGESDALAAVGLRLAEWLPSLVLQPLGLAGAVLIGAWAARRTVLERPAEHVRLLRWAAFAGVGIAWTGGLPSALVGAGIMTVPLDVAAALGALRAVSGFGGIGYVALVALAVVALGTRRGPVGNALAACGQRSLTCYLLQSVLFVALLAPFGAGWGSRIGVAESSGLAVATWLITVAAAVALDRSGHRGPAEQLLRWGTYLRRPASQGP